MRKHDFTDFNNYFKDKENEDKTYRLKDFTDMFGTGIYVNVPYQIDVDKYVEACGEKETRMSPETNKTVRFSCDFNKDTFTIFAFGDDYDEERDNAYYHYDCFMFHDYDYDDDSEMMKNAAIRFLNKLTLSIIDVDHQAIKKWIKKQREDISKIEGRINKLKEVTLHEFHNSFKPGDEMESDNTKLIAVPAATDASGCHICYSMDNKPCFFINSKKCPKCHSDVFSHTDYIGERIVFIEKDN